MNCGVQHDNFTEAFDSDKPRLVELDAGCCEYLPDRATKHRLAAVGFQLAGRREGSEEIYGRIAFEFARSSPKRGFIQHSLPWGGDVVGLRTLKESGIGLFPPTSLQGVRNPALHLVLTCRQSLGPAVMMLPTFGTGLGLGMKSDGDN